MLAACDGRTLRAQSRARRQNFKLLLNDPHRLALRTLESYPASLGTWLRRSLFRDKRALMAMFTVYGDASGSDPALPILALGGFISTVQQWEEFCKQWPKVLASGSVRVYHAADLESRKGEFARWSEKKKLKFQILAYQTLARYVAVGIASVVVRADFETLRIRWHRVRQGNPANHYIFCVYDFIKNVNNWAKDHGYINTPINYVFERGDPGKGEVEQIFQELASDPAFNDRH